MKLAFRNDIFCRIVDGRAIILDLATGRYASPSPAASSILAEIEADRSEAIPDHADLRALIDRGLLVPRTGVGQSHGFARWPQPDQVYQGVSETRCGTSTILLALARQIGAAVDLRRFRLSQVVERLRLHKGRIDGARDHHDLHIDRSVRAFSAADRICSIQDRCLPRSIALVRALAAGGICGNLVLGVRTYPFMAHAWVQIAGSVVADDLDRVRDYSPILFV